MSKMPKLRKTDRRFALYQHGFECYVEFPGDAWKDYNRYVRYCRDRVGPEFWAFSSRVFENGDWKGVAHYQGTAEGSKRVYLKNPAIHTMLLLVINDDINTVYL